MYIFIKNIEKSTMDLLKFDTKSESSETFILQEVESEIVNVNYKIIALNNNILLINSMNFDIYSINYDELNTMTKVGNIKDYGIEYSDINNGVTQIYDYTVKLDDESILIGINTGEDIKLIKIDINSNTFTEILNDKGAGYRYCAKPVIDGEYIYLSFINSEDASTICKYNWKTNIKIKQTTLEKYLKNNKQIGNLEIYKGE